MEFMTNTAAVSSHYANVSQALKDLPGKLGKDIQQGLSQLTTLISQTQNADDISMPTNAAIDEASPHIQAALVRISLETHDTKSYFFEAQDHLNDYKAGAHINIEFIANDETVNRTYTLSSSPKQSGSFSITVKRVKEGLASNWLFDNLAPSDTIKVSQPQGHFVLPYQPSGKLLMLSAGSGITPVMSMVRYLTQTGNRSDIVFLHYAQSADDIIFHDELTQLSENHPNISVSVSVERATEKGRTSKNTAIPYSTGRISKKQLSQIVPDILDRQIYLCGPQPFMKATMGILDQLTFNPSQLHLENFTADRSQLADSNYSSPLTFTSLLDTSPEAASVQSSPSRTILEEAEAAGLAPASACRMGICRTCRCKKQSGTTVNLITGEESSKENDYILPCVSVAKTATTVEL